MTVSPAARASRAFAERWRGNPPGLGLLRHRDPAGAVVKPAGRAVATGGSHYWMHDPAG